MNGSFCSLFDCVKKKKGYFTFLIIFSLLAIILGVVAAINFGGGVFSVDLSNIAYIRFLQGGGFVSMVFGLMLSLLMFFIAIILCNIKSYLIPLGVLFYLYLVYSQTVIFMSIILIYGILNCIILAVLLLVYTTLIWATFLLVVCEVASLTNNSGYLKSCCSVRESKVIWYLLIMLTLTFIFCLIMMILKNYVVLLIY